MVPLGLKLGLMGGTFNPIHLGHLRVAEEIAESLDLDRLIFIPASRPPHKDPSPVISVAHRLEMVKLATADRPGFFVSDVEGRRDGPSFTIETLRYFKQAAGPRTELFFLTGLDSFLEVDNWKEYHNLFKLASFVVITRPGSNTGRLAPLLKDRVSQGYTWRDGPAAFVCPGHKPVYFRPVSRLDVSSTDIRARLGRGQSIRYLVPEAVRRYILANGLYLRGEPGRREG
ncbi:MAG: nicotinate-nucleotide adenylyltransferase [Thermodesulfobacteriota bacterium]